MATGGGRPVVRTTAEGRIYEADDEIDDKLLNKVAKHVLYDRLQSFAINLGLKREEYCRIALPTAAPQARVFEVLKAWRSRTVSKVKDLIEEMVTWQIEGYTEEGIWKYLHTIINPILLPATIPTTQLPSSITSTNRELGPIEAEIFC